MSKMERKTVPRSAILFFLTFLLTLIGGSENASSWKTLSKSRVKKPSTKEDLSLQYAAHRLLKSALNDENLSPYLSSENETPVKLDSGKPRLNSNRGELTRGANGGFQCATCVILLGLVERWSVVNNASVDVNLAKFCNLVPGKVGGLGLGVCFISITIDSF